MGVSEVDNARIALCDDDTSITRMVSNYLSRSGFDVSIANSREQLEALVAEHHFDLLLLDLHLPDGHGLEIARWLRSKSESLGIIIVSGTEDEIDKVVGLEMGADDFVAKPFNERELLARVRTVLRRTSKYAQSTGEGTIRFGRFQLDLDTHELTDANGELVHLTSHEFSLLKLLISSTNRVLNRDQIMQTVAGRDWLYADRSVDVLVGKLRKKIEEDPSRPRLIKTIRGAGYKFTGASANTL